MSPTRFISLLTLLGWFTAGVLFFSGLAHASSAENDASADEGAKPVPSLADVVYRAGTLGQRLETLKTQLAAVDGLASLEQRLQQAKTRSDLLETRLQVVNADDLQSYQQLAALKSEIRTEAELVTQSVEAQTEAIRQVEEWRRQWLAEKAQWQQWRDVLQSDLALASVAEAFNRATADIDLALELISQKIGPMLAVQQQAGDIGSQINGLVNRIDAMVAEQRGGALRGSTPTIFSARYLRQLIDMLHEPGSMVKALSAPDLVFFKEKAWVVGLQIGIFAVLLILLGRHGARFTEPEDRQFLARRKISVSLFVTIFTLSFLYGSQPIFWRMLIQTLAGIATARLAAAFVQDAWIKWAITILVLVMVGFQLLIVMGVPLALMRLFILVWTVAGAAYYAWRARQGAVLNKPMGQIWMLRMISLVFLVIAITDTIGFGGLSVQLMDGAIRTAVLLLMGWVMFRLARVVLEMFIGSIPFGRVSFLRANAGAILSKGILAVKIIIAMFVAANLAVAWKLFTIPGEALQAVVGFGLTMGGQKFTVGLVLVAGLILYGSFVISWGLQGLLMENALVGRQLDTGARLSIMRLVHYALILIGFLLALSAMGFELKNVTIIGGALGVGIGFGMQAIVNNFVSGLILLFERPIKVGDVIQLGDGQQGRVTHLGLRATTVQTFDRAEVVVPNGDLISSQVTNWTLGDRSMRLIVPVGVAYGSDVETVMRVLMAVARDSDKVLKDPPPMVLFLNFGDSSLDFQLRVWIADFNERRIIQSALIQEIDRRFRRDGVEIPFPQRDLHLRSVEDAAGDRLTGASRASGEPSNSPMAPAAESEQP